MNGCTSCQAAKEIAAMCVGVNMQRALVHVSCQHNFCLTINVGMITACPNIHLSLAAYRLRVIRDLWNAVRPFGGISHGYESHHGLHTTASKQKDGRGRYTAKNSRRQRMRIQQAAKARRLELKNNAAIPSGSSKPYTDGVHSYLPNLSTSHPAGQEHDLQENPFPEYPPKDGGNWDPYTERGRDDLKSMLQELEHLTDKAANEPRTLQERGKEAVANGFGSVQLSFRSFDSPIQRRIIHNEEKPGRKVHLAFEEQDARLMNNPWAQMLSAPIRHDQGSKSRMPKHLLTTWGVARNPQDSMDYIVPIEASDLRALREQISITQTPKSDTIPDSIDGQAERIDGKRIYIQPNSVLLDAMANMFIKQSPGPGNKTHSLSPLLALKMIPWKWRESISQADTYRRTQIVIDKETGAESIDEEWRKDVPNIFKLQWQSDAKTRLNTILCQRIMIVLEGLLKHNSSNTGISSRRVYAMKLPKTGHLILDAQALVHERSSLEVMSDKLQATDETRIPSWHPGSYFLHIGSPKQYAQTIEMWREHKIAHLQDITAHDYVPNLPDSPLLPPMVTLTSSNKQTSPSTIRLPMFNLISLLGPTYTEPVQKLILEHKILHPHFWASYDDIRRRSILAQRVDESGGSNPQKVTKQGDPSKMVEQPIGQGSTEEQDHDAKTHVFLEDQSRLHEKQALQSQNQNSVSSPDSLLIKMNSSGDETKIENQKVNEAEKEYIVLIKSSAMKSSDLAQELWQLWRFIGGRDGLWLGKSEDEKNSSE